MTVAAFDPETGIAELSGDVWRAARDGGSIGEPHREALAAAGLFAEDRLLDPLAAAVQAVEESRVSLRVVPGAGAVVRVLVVPRMFAAAAVARLVGLRPRPSAATAAVSVEPTALAAALAAPGSGVVVPPALAEAIRRLDRRWRLEVDTAGAEHVLEVLDTADGLWRITQDDPDLTVEPIAAAQVWRALTRLPLP